jgi:hypothetical protein
MEFQYSQGKNYFLQYHRTRNFNASTFTLQRNSESEEIPAFFVRGHTPPEGIHIKTTAYYADAINDRDSLKWRLPESEEASISTFLNRAFSELLSRRTKVKFLMTSKLFMTLFGLVGDHVSKSEIFKPEISIIINSEKIFPESERYEMRKRTRETGENQYMNLYVISDGQRCFVRREK